MARSVSTSPVPLHVAPFFYGPFHGRLYNLDLSSSIRDDYSEVYPEHLAMPVFGPATATAWEGAEMYSNDPEWVLDEGPALPTDRQPMVQISRYNLRVLEWSKGWNYVYVFEDRELVYGDIEAFMSQVLLLHTTLRELAEARAQRDDTELEQEVLLLADELELTSPQAARRIREYVRKARLGVIALYSCLEHYRNMVENDRRAYPPGTESGRPDAILDSIEGVD